MRKPAPGYVFVTPAGPLMVDNDGGPVWVHPVPHVSANFQVQEYEGRPVLTWWQGEIASYGVGVRGYGVVMDTSYQVVTYVHPGSGLASDLHEFNLTDRGTALITAYAETSSNLSAAGGPSRGTLLDAVVQEVDVATGAVVFEWRAMEHLDLSESQVPYAAGAVYDPFHVNSIGVMPDGDLLISARNTWALYKVDRATGAVVWRLGGKRSDFTMGKGTRFAWQHDARWHADGLISVFDDEGWPYVGPQARGLILAVSERRRRVSVERAYEYPEEKLRVGSQGSVQCLPGGDVVVGWGSAPCFTEFRQGGSTVLEGTYATGTSYRAYRFQWRGDPIDPPAAAVERTSAGLVVYASWNGATEVASWQVLGGPSPLHFDALGSAARTGFETAIPIRADVAWISVRALDARGATLGTSDPLPTPF